jgi:hypothetical protein
LAKRKGRLLERSFCTLPPICAQKAARTSDSSTGSQWRMQATPFRAARRRASTLPTAVVGKTGVLKPVGGSSTPTGGTQRQTMKATRTSTAGSSIDVPAQATKSQKMRVECSKAAAEAAGMEHIMADATAIKGVMRAGQVDCVSKGDACIVGATDWIPLTVFTRIGAAPLAKTVGPWDRPVGGPLAGGALPAVLVGPTIGARRADTSVVGLDVAVSSRSIPADASASVPPAVEVCCDTLGRRRRPMVEKGHERKRREGVIGVGQA